MLVLSRKVGERLKIGEDVTLIIAAVHGNRVRLAFELPDNVRVLREELLKTIPPKEMLPADPQLQT